MASLKARFGLWRQTRNLKKVLEKHGTDVRYSFYYAGGSLCFSAPIATTRAEFAEILETAAWSLRHTS
jgi:hypothetical protein